MSSGDPDEFDGTKIPPYTLYSLLPSLPILPVEQLFLGCAGREGRLGCPKGIWWTVEWICGSVVHGREVRGSWFINRDTSIKVGGQWWRISMDLTESEWAKAFASPPTHPSGRTSWKTDGELLSPARKQGFNYKRSDCFAARFLNEMTSLCSVRKNNVYMGSLDQYFAGFYEKSVGP